jgi:hypothetical protein
MSVVNSQNVSVANAKRDYEIRRIKKSLDSLHAEIRRGAIGANGLQNEYLADRLEFLKVEADRLQQEVARLHALSDKELVAEFLPDLSQREAMANEPVPALSLDPPTNSGRSFPARSLHSGFRQRGTGGTEEVTEISLAILCFLTTSF